MRTPEADDLRRTPGAWRRFLGAVVALLAVAIGIPIALVLLSRAALHSWHPLPGIGPWDEITDWFTHELSSTQIAVVALRVLLCVMWLLWASLLVSVLASVADTRPSLKRLRLPHVTAFDGIGGWIAAGLTALSSLAPNVAHTSPLQPVAPVVAMSEATPATPASISTLRVASRAGWARVQTGESIEMFAARTLGDSTRWEDIWALNRGRTMDDRGTTWSEPWRLLGGWDLELPPQPASAAVGGLRLVADPAVPVTAPPAVDESDAASNSHVYVVKDGDSYWSIAEHTLRIELGVQPTDRQVLAETNGLMAINVDRLGSADVPEMLHTGDVVQLTPEAGAAATASTDATVYVVADGDSYWRIAEHVLRGELGRAPSGAQVLIRTNELIARNHERLGSPGIPHMLHTGDVVQLADPPPLETAPAPAAAAPSPTSPAPQETTASSPPVSSLDEPIVPRVAEVSPRTATTASEAGAGRTGGGSSGPAVAPTSHWSQDVDGSAPFEVGRLAGMSAVAFAGLAGAWAIRRSRAARRARPHERPAPIAPVEVAAARELAGREASGVEWMAAELRLLVAALPESARASLTVQLVQLGVNDELEVAFVEIPPAAPPPGWVAAAERVWRLTNRHSTSAVNAVTDLPPVVPALVTLGDASPGQLLFNLESVGGVNVRGDAESVAAWVNSAVWELAGGALAERSTVILVDAEVPGAGELPAVTSMTAHQAALLVENEHPSRLRGDASMLVRRAAGSDSWPPTLIVVGDCRIDEELWTALASRPAVAVISIGTAIPGGLDVEITSGHLSIPAWGLRIAAAGLDAATAGAAVEVLAAADAEPVPDDLHIAVPTATTPLEPSAHSELDDGWEPPSWPVIVRLLGEPYATRDGHRLSLTPQQLSALAYLAVMRDVSVDEFNEALWSGAEVKGSRRRELLTDLRKLSGGRNVVGHVEDGRIRAGVDLGTDLLVLEALNARAQEASNELTVRLHEVMNLVNGQPFSYASAASHLWRWVDHPEHLQALWGLRVSTVAWELAGLYLQRDNAGAARDTAERGLIADPLNAALTERLMESYAAMHAVEAVQRVYESHDRALAARGFDGASEETRRVLERLRSAHAAEVDSAVGS